MKIFLRFLSLFLFCAGIIFSVSNEERAKQIDRQIEELVEIKRGYDGKAVYHANQADRLQFVNGELSNAKKHWVLSDHYNKLSLEVEKKIEELKKERIELEKS